MALWPFGRKSKKSSQPADNAAMAATRSLPPEPSRRESTPHASDRSTPTLGRRPSRGNNQRRPRSTSRKLSKSNAPSNRTSEKVDHIPPVPVLPEQRRAELNEKSGFNKSNQQAPNMQQQQPPYYYQNPMSTSSLQAEKFSVIREPPTLQGKRSANDGNFPRRKSSKRKTNDHAREQEIKAMSSPVPIPKRPVSHQPGMLAQDSKKIPGGLNRRFTRPLSDVSLPLPESMLSQISVASDQHSFKVSAFDALSPRPTIRYSGNPRSPAGSAGPSRTSTRKEKHPMIVEEPSRSKKRINELADDMDAGSLRELMERDRRRHEKHRQSEHEKLERRLQRRAEKQQQREGGTDEAGKVARDQEKVEDVKLEQERSPLPVIPGGLSAPAREEGTRTPESWLKDPSRDHLPVGDPFHDTIAGGSMSHLEAATPDERDDPVLETAKAVRLSQASISPPTSPTRQLHEPSNLSQFSELAPSPTPDIAEQKEIDHRRDSDTSARFSSNWKSIFRRSDTKAKRDSADRGRVTPSEFSNTSRESIARQMPPSAFTRIPRARSGTPIRTQSRFREDLPELPISPPDSRIQSPEAKSLPEIPGSQGSGAAGATENAPLSDIHPAYREEVALSRNASLRATSRDGPIIAAVPQSLASVDSEGSWLRSGSDKRTSQPLRESGGSLQQRFQEPEEPEEEAPGTPDEEKYMGSLIPTPSETAPAIPPRKHPYMMPAAGMGVDNENTQEEATWHGAVGKHPTIVRQGPGQRTKSREGLLNDFQTAEESPESSPSNDSPVGPENPFISRATSVDLGKGHARHISAGSARLLNLPPRSSTELKRLSASSGERSPLGMSSQPSPRLPDTKASDVD